MKIIKLFVIFCLCYYSTAVVASDSSYYGPEYEGIRKAIFSCTISRPVVGACPDGAKMTVDVTSLYKGYAVALVKSANGEDADSAYLQKKNGKWVLLDEGTGVNPYDLGIPQEILNHLH